MSTSDRAGVAVLIVEDEVLVRMDAASSIEDAGYVVYEAKDADEAIRQLELHSEIRFVFTDVNMPGSMDGLKLAHYVRKRWPPVKLIITSGLVNLREEDMPTGAVFVQKPYQSAHITGRMREMLSS
jgi:two-component system, response regulator PdtaR